MPTRVGPKLMSLQRFRVEEGTCPGEGVSGTMDERPEVDSGRPAPATEGLGRNLPKPALP
jgi:hypothetical protein